MMGAIDTDTSLSKVRRHAASIASTLDPKQCKRYGQFFTGLPLSRILAALSTREACTSVIDPMAGHGDLLDAVFERCTREGITLRRADAIEVLDDTAQLCLERLEPWRQNQQATNIAVHTSTAFDSELIRSLPSEGYDLVITNPPYVRYQTVANSGNLRKGDALRNIRSNLLQIASDRVPKSEQDVWRELIQGFSGLSDLSVPSWLLAAMLVKPGGVLAVVAPATWRNRDYADVLQYLLARCFELETVVSDRQPGWFSKVLVRTNLVVATRLSSKAILTPLCHRRPSKREVVLAEVDRIAKLGESLVGAAFPGEDPEAAFAQWVLHKRMDSGAEPKGVTVKTRREDILSWVRSVPRSSSWLKRLEFLAEDTPLFASHIGTSRGWIPPEVLDVLPKGCETNLRELPKAGIEVGQGLRTGCNGFFYVEMVEKIDERTARVRLSDVLGGDIEAIPMDALKPVLRCQAEIDAFSTGSQLPSYVLDLRNYVLRQHWSDLQEHLHLYKDRGVSPPKIMPEVLANIVKRAAKTKYGSSGRYIPDLSAVRTNSRDKAARSNGGLPRFWYMLPDFMPRHIPDAFVPRINQNSPRALRNRVPPIVIDANFSTLWAGDKTWTPGTIVTMMNSAWVRACMEAIGTPMGGGALKLEAAHLRRLPMPKLSATELQRISEIAEHGYPALSVQKQNEVDSIIVKAILRGDCNDKQASHIISGLRSMTERLSQARQRV